MDYTILLTLIFTLYATMTYLSAKGERKEWATERKDLYDRIMSKDLQEYKWHTDEVKIYEPVSKDDNDLYEQEIEDNKM